MQHCKQKVYASNLDIHFIFICLKQSRPHLRKGNEKGIKMANTKKKLDYSSCLPVCFYNKTSKRKKIIIQPQSRHDT